MAARKGTMPPNAGKGRPKGVPNKATGDVREAIALLLRGNVERLQEWLTAVAEGLQEARLKNGEPVMDDGGNPVTKWIRPPDPGHAIKLMADLAEYHIPKLARTELTGKDGKDLEVLWPLAKNKLDQ